MKILSYSVRITPPFFEMINPAWMGILPINDMDNPLGGKRPEFLSPEKQIVVEVVAPIPIKKNHLKSVK